MKAKKKKEGKKKQKVKEEKVHNGLTAEELQREYEKLHKSQSRPSR